VIGYNQLTAQLREFAARMDDFGRELLNAIENAAMLSTPAAPPVTPPAEEVGALPRRRTF
jgi:biopolymer transport protein TolQ